VTSKLHKTEQNENTRCKREEDEKRLRWFEFTG